MNTDAPTSTHWQSLAVEKIAEMDELIKRTRATRTWLAEALKRECKGIDECIMLRWMTVAVEWDDVLLCPVNFRH